MNNYRDEFGINEKKNWIFDLDGTLTVSVHDFDYVRSELGLDDGVPILEALKSMPSEKAAPLWQRLNEIEFHYASKARVMEGSVALLEKLAERGVRLGIFTRNMLPVVKETLRACKLEHLFPINSVVDRDTCTPKPSPDGIYYLLELWQGRVSDTVMVGDYLYDLQSGRHAGVTTIHVDNIQGDRWPEYTDIYVQNFSEITQVLDRGAVSPDQV